MSNKNRYVTVAACGQRKEAWDHLVPLILHYAEPGNTAVLMCHDDRSAQCARHLCEKLGVHGQQIDFRPTTDLDEEADRTAGQLLEAALLRTSEEKHVILCIDSNHAAAAFRRLTETTYLLVLDERTRAGVSLINANEAAVLNITAGTVHKLVG
jgi:hypothetical protein